VLFKAAHEDRVHWVHLTWSVEKDPHWPSTESYQSLDDFRERWPREELDEDAGGPP
jgi:hypothetical protein